MSAQSAPAMKSIEIEKLRDWRVRLHGIVEPTVRYQKDRDVMKDAVISQNAATAKSLIEEIEELMGAFL